jgi:pyruvyl transferase EpsO
VGTCDWEGDWKQLLGGSYVILRLLQAYMMVAGKLGHADLNATVWKALTRRVIRRCAGRLKAARCIETSRLHGHIFAALLGVPSRLHDNSYGKNSAYYRLWHSDMPLPGQSLVTAQNPKSPGSATPL